MKKLSKKEQKVNLLILVVAITLVGASVIYYLKKGKASSNKDDASTDNISDFIEPLKQQATIEQPKPGQDFEEVNNTWFKKNRFAYSTVDNLNVRSIPGQFGEIIAQIELNEFIGKHTGKSTNIGWPSDPGTWAKVMLEDGRIGWVFSGMITSEEDKRLNGLPVMKYLA